MTEKEAYIAFNLTEGVGSVKLAGLVSMFGSVASAWENYPHKTGRIPGVIDWERCLWADPLMEVGFRTYDGNKAIVEF